MGPPSTRTSERKRTPSHRLESLREQKDDASKARSKRKSSLDNDSAPKRKRPSKTPSKTVKGNLTSDDEHGFEGGGAEEALLPIPCARRQTFTAVVARLSRNTDTAEGGEGIGRSIQCHGSVDDDVPTVGRGNNAAPSNPKVPSLLTPSAAGTTPIAPSLTPSIWAMFTNEQKKTIATQFDCKIGWFEDNHIHIEHAILNSEKISTAVAGTTSDEMIAQVINKEGISGQVMPDEYNITTGEEACAGDEMEMETPMDKEVVSVHTTPPSTDGRAKSEDNGNDAPWKV